ncbi:CPBP family intramembrane glutamic endopeptidase [Thermotoga sp. KOL6]|uniref:CPBP family intramembrane glutamic endopeptidase n=1 Tax=Thermotoga sp. KOL6 TaxID=126741 RepID=UPI000C78EF85|nr:CPBP family intramembrane glutamic endopeptidase [Thermotoga sp. KOL6]
MNILYSLIALAIYLMFMFSINIFKIRRFERAIFFQSLLGLAGAVTACAAFQYLPSFKLSLADFHWFLILLSVNVFFMRNGGAHFPSFANWLIVMISVSFISPLSEELFFRGVLLKLNNYNIWLNAFIFSFLHLFNVIVGFEKFFIVNLIYRFIVALIFAHSVVISGSLFPAIFYHSMNNLVAFILMTRRGGNAYKFRRNRRLWEEHTSESFDPLSEEKGTEGDSEERTGGDETGREDQKDSSGGGSDS